MKNVTNSLLLLLAAAPSLVAQTPVTIRCDLADGRQTGCYYCPGYDHVIKFVGTQIASPSINLTQFHNQFVLLHGTWDGSIVTVTQAQATAESFSLTGNGQIGSRFRPKSYGNPGELAMNLVALTTAFSVPYLDLAFQLSPIGAVVQGIGTINGAGEFRTDLDIPNDPLLIGLRIFGQGVVMDSTLGLLTTNVDAKEIQP
ncbi:MAG: hypothetical protein U1E73_05720 [Planctomycetota bacterium]